MSLSWSKKYLYNPFDLTIDRVKKEATRTRETQVWKNVPPDVRTTYAFHQRYVVDVHSVIEGSKNKRERTKALQQAIQDRHGGAEVAVNDLFGIRYLLRRFPGPSLSRQLVAGQLTRLIEIQEIDNEVQELKKHREYTRGKARGLRAWLQRKR